MAKKLSESEAVARLEGNGYQVQIDSRYLTAKRAADVFQIMPTNDGRYPLTELRKIPA
ncbi:hypothetical protein O9X98_13790 [Agrobacterium salinitolerans]|nr:hypothetical protein [Agrobacterium salinitolerans]